MTYPSVNTRRAARKLPDTPIIVAIKTLMPRLKDALDAEAAVQAESVSNPGFQTRMDICQQCWEDVLDHLQKICDLPVMFPEEASLQLAADLIRRTLDLQNMVDEAALARSRAALQSMSAAPFGCSITHRRVALFAQGRIRRLLSMRAEIDALIFG